MKRFFVFILALIATLLLSSCGGKGSASSAPANVSIVTGDSSVTISWDAQPGVEYWIWKTAGTSIDIPSCTSACTTLVQAASPTVITGLVNGQAYAFTINGRTSGGPGGPGSTSISVTPRLAGGLDLNGISTWKQPSALNTQEDLHGIAYGVPLVNTLTENLVILGSAGVFVAAGNNGSLFSGLISSIDGSVSWTPSGNTLPHNNLNAVTFNNGKFLAVGDGGEILLSSDGTNWTVEPNADTHNLYAVSNIGLEFIAVGDSGTILTSSGGGVNWTRSSPTTESLYGITYGAGMLVAVGAGGTFVYSSDNGATWQETTQHPAPLPDLKSVAYGAPQLAELYYLFTPQNGYTLQTPPLATFVAAGVNGTVLTSQDGITWSTQNPIQSNSINAVTYGHEFVAVGDGGSIFTSIDGLTWTTTHNDSPLLPNLYTVLPTFYSGGQYANHFGYAAVGANGSNMFAQ